MQILEDVSEEHARKTITVDPFPNTGVPSASIHPCKHASVMKKLIGLAESSGKPMNVDRWPLCALPSTQLHSYALIQFIELW